MTGSLPNRPVAIISTGTCHWHDLATRLQFEKGMMIDEHDQSQVHKRSTACLQAIVAVDLLDLAAGLAVRVMAPQKHNSPMTRTGCCFASAHLQAVVADQQLDLAANLAVRVHGRLHAGKRWLDDLLQVLLVHRDLRHSTSTAQLSGLGKTQSVCLLQAVCTLCRCSKQHLWAAPSWEYPVYEAGLPMTAAMLCSVT
jgi:hypothetical protein